MYQDINNDKEYNFRNEEIEKAKENGFILIGKTGVGKTSLLNVICGKDRGIVGYSSQSETKKSSFFCVREKINSEYKYFCIVDTPGLYDTNGREADKIQKDEILKLISDENIKIKGLFFLSNFQNERFDSSEQNTLIEYNAIFPLKEFWNRIILIFTHYYGDPDGDSKEEILKRSDNTFSNIFEIIMNRVKEVSKPVKFEHMNKKYINIYSRSKNEKQKENNLKIRNDLIDEIIKYSKLNPMFSRLQIYKFEKFELKPKDKYLYDLDLYIYMDANNKRIHEEIKNIEKYEKSNDILKKQNCIFNSEDYEINEEGNLVKKTKKNSLMEVFKNYKGEVLTILSIVGILSSISFAPIALPVSMVGLFQGGCFINQKDNEKNKKNEIIKNQILEQKLIDEINKKINNNS